MATAVRFQKLNSSGVSIGNVDFERYEIKDSRVLSTQESIMQKAQNGDPTLFLQADEYLFVEIQFRNHGNSTTAKFTEMRNFINAGGILRLFPKYISDSANYYDGFIEPKALPVEQLFSGEYKGGDIIKVKFYESTMDSQYVAAEDIVME